MTSKLSRLRSAMDQDGIEAVLVSDTPNVGWLTGFTGSFGRAFVTPNQAIFLTDGRYDIQAREEVSDLEIRIFVPPVTSDDFLAEQVNDLKLHSLSFLSSRVTYHDFESLRGKLPSVELKPISDIIAPLRMIKDESEVSRIRRACGVADATFEHIQRMIQPGVREIDVALDLEFFIRRQGADVAFASIVVSGNRSARPHGKPSEKPLELGDFVTLDFGATVEGYHSDITRTVVVGTATDRHREVYSAVLESQLAALQAMRPGVSGKEADAVARTVLQRFGLDGYFTHGLGHTLGRDVHDGGRMSPTGTDVLEPGQVWTVEPGVYIEGFGGVRIEDDVLVTEEGIEVLTHSTKDLLELPK